MEDAKLVEITGRMDDCDLTCHYGDVTDLFVRVFPDEVTMSKKWLTRLVGKRVRVTVEVLDG